VRRVADEALHTVGVAGVVRDAGGRVLLIRTATAGWELPGGRVEPGEDFIAALKREVREETGCDVEVARLTGVASAVTAPGLTLFTFLCRHTAGEPHPGDDSLEAGWFGPEAAVALVTHPVEQARLKDALEGSQGVTYRAYRRLAGDGGHGERYEQVLLHHG
jgi:8-oxo-dGTP pyrophosphatase MutT (NUDIX family)